MSLDISLRHNLHVAWAALSRNRGQAALAILGVMIGVGALVASLALGRGAQNALDEQLRAAGANMILVTSGNYQVKREQRMDGGPAHGAADPETPPRNPARPRRVIQASLVPTDWFGWRSSQAPILLAHDESDPMAVHDHPTAAERLGDAEAGLGAAATLTRDDARAIEREIAGIEHVVSGVHENVRVFADEPGGKQWYTRLHGTEADLPRVRAGWAIRRGRFLSDGDVESAAQVMVLGRIAADRLFGPGNDPVGRTAFLWNQPFRIVGMVDGQSWAAAPAAGDDQFDAVYVPVTTVARLLNVAKLNTVLVTTRSVGDTTRISGEVAKLLRKRHGIAENHPDDFEVRTQAQQLLGKGLPPEIAHVVKSNMRSVDQLTIEQLSSSLTRANRTMLILLGSVAAVSLLVGGVGVMNLLLLSVTQRTREVGLRIALGARQSDIGLQFMLEAMLLTLIGGVLGIAAGLGAAQVLQQFFRWSAVVSPMIALTAVGAAALLGVVFGVYPARRAAALLPIDALRHE
ncbi:ABC transporter permease [Sphingobium cloacae]|uniref:ABC transporter permease n=1 Tax=Sphingobium cloacae TaxID=120107 RepID=A0A1E1F4Z4_9SPHN|nr:ABC transporter permease [Sphingobium cloacae]BAV65589.1 hypothetical protein SCLO_1025490 [Sphingobium cloacae]